MLDLDACREVSKDMRAEGEAWEVIKISGGVEKKIPKSRGVYMFVWAPELVFSLDSVGPHRRDIHEVRRVIYVGSAGGSRSKNSAGTMRDRYYNEYRRWVYGDPRLLWKSSGSSSRPIRLETYLALRPLEFWALSCDDSSLVDSIEQRLIHLLDPPMNDHHRPQGPRLRRGTTSPAFK